MVSHLPGAHIAIMRAHNSCCGVIPEAVTYIRYSPAFIYSYVHFDKQYIPADFCHLQMTPGTPNLVNI